MSAAQEVLDNAIERAFGAGPARLWRLQGAVAGFSQHSLLRTRPLPGHDCARSYGVSTCQLPC